MTAIQKKPDNLSSVAGYNGAFVCNDPGVRVENNGTMIIPTSEVTISRIEVNGDVATNVVAQYIQNPANPIDKDAAFTSKATHYFSAVEYTGGKVTIVNL